MNSNLGKLVQKSSGPFCEHLGNPRLECNFERAERPTFAFWERARVSAQKSVKLKRELD
jgi:hypothetical protein